MATVHITLNGISNSGNAFTGVTQPVLDAIPAGKETITSSGTSQATTLAAANEFQFFEIVATGGNVWIKAGTAPTAAESDDRLVLDGERVHLAAKTGHKIAVIDA